MIISRPIIFSLLFSCFTLLACNGSFAQANTGAVTFHIYSSHTSFPDTGRRNGHLYDNVLYANTEHYRDSTVLIVAPKNLDVKKQVDLIFWFHGWRNNIDTAAIRYELIKQFIASKRNAVLVLAETARNAPDSYGGKLENDGVFKSLVTDILNGLKIKRLIPANDVAGHILLSGHSGAYRVIARILKNGNMQVDEVMLFDALYAETDKFTGWLSADKQHRFINLYTDHGGTLDETHNMIKLLDQDDINYFQIEETALVPAQYRAHSVLFIHSLKQHDDIVNPDNFRLMLENNPFLKPLK
ncbi:MAG TPA: hypothetical protein VNW95_08075 [Mucilaginibacter sp.]|jgi:hypothetical protein|nr:hypothetical protein [Mucilaginibacter sp.]